MKGFDLNPTLVRLTFILGKGEMNSNCVGKSKTLSIWVTQFFKFFGYWKLFEDLGGRNAFERKK